MILSISVVCKDRNENGVPKHPEKMYSRTFERMTNEVTEPVDETFIGTRTY